MTDHGKPLDGPALLQELLPVPPSELPGLAVYLVSQSKVRALSGRLPQVLDPDETARAAEFATRELRDRFVFGRIALRCVLSALEAGAVSEADWRFGAPANGRPFVRRPKDTVRSFNLSYAGDLIAIAASKEVEVGVDIEPHHEVPLGDLPWHLFSPGEQELLRATPTAELSPVFLRLWTLKEAIAKRTGEGFAAEFSEIDTAAMPAIDGWEALRRRPKADALLFHTDLVIEGQTFYLSVSTAPLLLDDPGHSR